MNFKDYIKQQTKLYSVYSHLRQYYAARWDRRSMRTLKKNGSIIITEIENVLNKYGIKHFFDFGTMLGIVRDKGIIPGDSDIDIGVIIDSNEDLRKISLLNNDERILKVRQFCIETYGIAEESYFYKDKVRFDLHFYYGSGNDRFCFLFYRLEGIEYVSSEEFDAVKVSVNGIVITPYIFRGQEISLPNNPEDIIVQKYGANWRTPDRGWPYWEGPCSEKIAQKGCLKLFLR